MKRPTTPSPARLVSISGLAREIGISRNAARNLHEAGIITPAIHEGPRLIRFDADAVRETLRKRAAKKAKRPLSKLPPGMVPVI
jgi:hypothetical protein